jgi:hypothetical protein
MALGAESKLRRPGKPATIIEAPLASDDSLGSQAIGLLRTELTDL